MRLFIRLSTIAQKSQQSASKWLVLAFYRVASCLRIKTNLNKLFLIFSYFCTERFRNKTWVLIIAAEKIIPRYKKLMQKNIQFPISNFPFPFPVLVTSQWKPHWNFYKKSYTCTIWSSGWHCYSSAVSAFVYANSRHKKVVTGWKLQLL